MPRSDVLKALLKTGRIRRFAGGGRALAAVAAHRADAPRPAQIRRFPAVAAVIAGIAGIAGAAGAAQVARIPVPAVPEVPPIHGADNCAEHLAHRLRPGDVLVTLGAGNIGTTGYELFERLRKDRAAG